MRISSILVFLTLSLYSIDAVEHWGYKHTTEELDPDHWYLKYKTCIGNRQSPIDIEKAYVQYAKNLDKINFVNYDKAIPVANITNDGHTVRVDIPDTADIHVTSAGWNKKYKLKQFHFHWSHEGTNGSEHTIFGKHYPLEMHMVHADETVSFENAQQEPYGLVVLSVLFDFASEDQHLADLTSKMLLIVDPLKKATTQLRNLIVNKLLPETKFNYLQYYGSLTTPPCNEAVNWVILTNVGHVTRQQLQIFRTLKHVVEGNVEEPLESNERTLQSIKDRKVYLHYTFDDFGQK